MSELIKSNKNKAPFRWQLLATASAMTLLGYTAQAVAQSDEPQVWIELGGQLTRLDVGQESFSPASMDERPAIFPPSTKYEKLPHQSVDESGKLSFQPAGSDWVFSAAVQYGRSVRQVDVSQQTYPGTFDPLSTLLGGRDPLSAKFASTLMKAKEGHLLLDFQAGKDVGLGAFGGGVSQINFGIRFAQFNSRSNITLNSDPDWQRFYKYITYPSFHFYHSKVFGGSGYHLHSAKLQAQRSYHGIGPSLTWSGSSPFFGNGEDGELTLNYGANASVLFGRQRAKVAHQSSSVYHTKVGKYPQRIQTNHSTTHIRSHALIVPNVGGFAGVTYRIHDFKISAGYRGDFFFGAVDGGNDVRKSETIGNYGPFATISIGLGG